MIYSFAWWSDRDREPTRGVPPTRDACRRLDARLAATNKCLARSNKSLQRTNAIKEKGPFVSGHSDEKMRPMSWKTRIRFPLSDGVEQSLAGPCALLFDPL